MEKLASLDLSCHLAKVTDNIVINYIHSVDKIRRSMILELEQENPNENYISQTVVSCKPFVFLSFFLNSLPFQIYDFEKFNEFELCIVDSGLQSPQTTLEDFLLVLE
jgi:hypothetical protein